MKTKRTKRLVQHRRIRATLGNTSVHRIAVFRSNQYISAQLIDDVQRTTIAYERGKKNSPAEVGEALGKKAVAAGVKSATFDRAGYRYHGRVKALADGIRKGGLKM